MFQDFRFLALHTASVSLLEGFKSQYFLKKYVVHVAMKTLDLTNVHTDAQFVLEGMYYVSNQEKTTLVFYLH